MMLKKERLQKQKKKRKLKVPSLGLRHRRKITGSHFGCLFLFVQKILKPDAFRHTISESILNLLEGSDAIYGVIVTRHAADRMQERGGLNRKSIQRIANQVYSNGYPIERTKGRLRKWMYKISKSNPSAQNLRIYGDKLYIFSNDVLITVFNIPNNLKKDLPKMIDKEGTYGSS